jgi:hypothetical protein
MSECVCNSAECGLAPEGIVIELTWDAIDNPAPGENRGTDVDIHLQRPWPMRPSIEEGGGWFGDFETCNFRAPAPDWGVMGNPDDDPMLIRDGTQSPGVEVIRLNAPQVDANPDQPFLVGVHYYRANPSQFGDPDLSSNITVRIFLSGELALEREIIMENTYDLWEAAAIIWTADDRRAIPLEVPFYRVDPLR